MTSDALILFCKYPEPSRVKTRIALYFGDDFAVGLQSSFLQDILSMSTEVTADKIIVIDASDSVPSQLLDMETGYKTIRQKGEDIGVRMSNAFLQVFEMGYCRAVLIGSDSPDLPSEFIQNALDSLIVHDAALGESMDGGYYLIGFQKEKFDPDFFKNIEWISPWVYQQTFCKIRDSKRSIYRLPRCWDIDDKDDLVWFYNRKIKENASSHTIDFINKIKEQGLYP